MTKPPYQVGDVLAIVGPGVGLHLFIAERPAVEINGRWYMGWQGGRKWGPECDQIGLRHATKADVERLLERHRAELRRAAEEVQRIEELAKRIKGTT